MKSHHIILIHGLFGWGKKELGGLPYWGYAGEVDHQRFRVHEASCGPVSSFHDRACEVAAQIKGAQIDYGASHSEDEGHSQFSDDYTGKAFIPDWSENNPVIIIGHSAGGHTALRLQRLLPKSTWTTWNTKRVSITSQAIPVVQGKAVSALFSPSRRICFCPSLTGYCNQQSGGVYACQGFVRSVARDRCLPG